MNQVVTASQKNNIATVRDALDKMKPQFMAVLPKHITPDRLCRVAMTAIQTTPKLLECDKHSLYAAIIKAAQLGLEPDGILGQAYLIPYGNQVQFIPGYKGLIDLARRSGEVSNIIAKEVYEGDEFDVDWSKDMPFHHKPNLGGDRGKVTHFWALARFKDGGFHWDYMTVDEVAAIRDSSQGYKAAVSWSKNSRNTKTAGQIISPWEQNFVEMGKKTVIRRIAKFLPMSVQRAAAFDELQDAGKQPSIDDYGDITIDGTAEHVDTEKNPAISGKLDSFAGETVDQQTGEVIENPPQESATLFPDPEANQDGLVTHAGLPPLAAKKPAVQEKEPPVPFVPVSFIDDSAAPDQRIPDWDAWVNLFITEAGAAPSITWLAALKEKNEKPLANLLKAKPDLHKKLQATFTDMVNQLTPKATTGN